MGGTTCHFYDHISNFSTEKVKEESARGSVALGRYERMLRVEEALAGFAAGILVFAKTSQALLARPPFLSRIIFE